MPRPGCRVRSHAVWAVTMVLACALPMVAAAEPPHWGHWGGHFGGGHAAHPPVRGFAGHGPGRAWSPARRPAGPGEDHWHAGVAPRQGWAHDRWHSGDWGDRWHRGGPGGWHGDWDGHWRGGDWDDRYWSGGLWVGGDWDGAYWPPVDYDWDYPWYLPTVPYGAVTLWFGDVPYYYVNRVYYIWSPNYGGYVLADPPPVAARRPGAPPSAAESSSGVLSLQVIPRKGQSQQQTANDRYACHQWAVGQSGFDPINSQQDAHASSAQRDGYRRALTACLNARGYSVRMPSR